MENCTHNYLEHHKLSVRTLTPLWMGFSLHLRSSSSTWKPLDSNKMAKEQIHYHTCLTLGCKSKSCTWCLQSRAQHSLPCWQPWFPSSCRGCSPSTWCPPPPSRLSGTLFTFYQSQVRSLGFLVTNWLNYDSCLVQCLKMLPTSWWCATDSKSWSMVETVCIIIQALIKTNPTKQTKDNKLNLGTILIAKQNPSNHIYISWVTGLTKANKSTLSIVPLAMCMIGMVSQVVE